MTKSLVFTDLDSTLLDHHSYSYAEAVPAIRSLTEAGFPLICNSSKTAAEINPLRQLIGYPLISELHEGPNNL